MKKTLLYKFDHKRKLIYEIFRGDIKLDDFLKHEKAKMNDSSHNDSYSLLIDIRESTFIFSNEEKKVIYSMFRKVASEINMKRKCAFLTSNPSEVVSSELFKMTMSQFSPMKFKAFSTAKAAYDWLEE